jgi:F0F1-type ATP synthase gamma subunit
LGTVQIVHPRALSLVNYRVEHVTLLPVSLEKETSPAAAGPLPEIIFESTPGKILEFATYLSFGHKMNYIFGLSRLAEVAARYTHLEESAQRIEDLNKKLKQRYFRLRHEVIDASMRELFASRSVYAD